MKSFCYTLFVFNNPSSLNILGSGAQPQVTVFHMHDPAQQ